MSYSWPMRPVSPAPILKNACTSAFLVTNLTNIRYLTGIELSKGAMVITKRSMTLFVDSRYIEAAEREAFSNIRVRPREDLPKAMSRIRQCGFEADVMTVTELRYWKRKYKNTKFVQKEGIIEEFRRAKDPSEMKKFRKAQRITKMLMKRVPILLKPGKTEREVAEQLRRIAIDAGADGLSFDPIVAFNKRSSSPHHHPSNQKFKKGMMVQIDVGARFQGYCADQSAVFFTGKKSKKQEKAYKAVAEAKAAAIKATTPGASNHDVYAVGCDVLQQYGMREYFTHALGHGVGLDIHEGTNMTDKGDEVSLLKNEIVTIEPGVYFPGEFGIRLEEEVVVK